MKKIFATVLALCAVLCLAVGFAACDVNLETDTIAFTVDGSDFNVEGKFLIDYMEYMQEEGAFTFTVKDGMIASVDGRENADGYYWMIYTSDSVHSNASYGKLDYDGEHYNSATLGVESLPLVDGATYVLNYEKPQF